MPASELTLLNNLRTISRYSIAAGVLLCVGLRIAGSFPLELQVGLALLALALGIPHGAVDHIVTVPKSKGLRRILFIIAYLAVVGLAIFGILSHNSLGFQIVVLMSAIHFGIGDSAFISEIDRRTVEPRRFPKLIYALAAGFVPVVIPLVTSESSQALGRVNPNLIAWAGSFVPVIFSVTVTVGIVAISVMALAKRWQEVIDLTLLLALALVGPPLVAFGFYFGLWHALRHTGRLTLELESSKQLHANGKGKSAFFKAFLAGVPALAATLVFALILALNRSVQLNQDFLWFLLVTVWALTVPHMALTARIDLRALNTKEYPRT